jgi:Prohead core protein serine protease
MKLITELVEEVQYVTEAKENGEKQHYIHGIFLQSERKNRNGRIYPKSVMEKEVNRYISEVMHKNRAYGELGHPEGPQINLDRVSHIITELKWDGDNVIGKAKLTDTPMGNIARGLLASGANLGVSSRALGSLQPDNRTGAMIVQPDLRLATAADIVADPSAPDAFVEGIMEGVEWIYDSAKGSWHEEKLDNMKRAIHKMSITQLEEQKLAIFENYISSLAFKNQ